VAGWDALLRNVRKRSEHSGCKYARYCKGYWKRYKKQRKQRFQRTIGSLKSMLDKRPDPYPVRPEGTVGRPPMPPKTILIAVMFKVLLELSYLDTESFLRWVSNNHLLMDVPAASTIQQHMKEIPLEYLYALLMESAAVLEGNDVTILMDATGLSTDQYGRWRSARTSSRKIKRRFVKLHISVDLETKKILIGIPSKGWKGDHQFGLRMLEHLRRTMRRSGFEVERVIADAGYLSRVMATEIEILGGEPSIGLKSNTTAKAGAHPAYRRMVMRAKRDPDAFRKVYCYRVVIEGIISALKSLFGHRVASRKRHNQDVEILCRLILWNYGRVELA